jgi:segregation and condensation protein A
MEAEGRMHPRQAGLEDDLLKLMPDYLEGITLRSLGVICADLLNRREVFLLEAEHVAAMPISLELHVRHVAARISRNRRVRFSDLLGANASAEEVVVTFLAILELYKRGEVDLRQDLLFGDIEIMAAEEGA